MQAEPVNELHRDLVRHKPKPWPQCLFWALAGASLTGQAPLAPYPAPLYPPGIAGPRPQTATEQQLLKAESLGGGRGLQFLWAEGGLGYRHVALEAVSGKDLLGSSSAKATDPTVQFEAAAGVRLIFLTAGAQLRTMRASDWTLWSVGGVAGLHWPYGNFEPSAHISVGYAWLRDLPAAAGDIDGIHWGASGQLRWYLWPQVSLAVRADLEMLALGRDASGQAPAGSPYSSSASAIGVSGGASALFGVHY